MQLHVGAAKPPQVVESLERIEPDDWLSVCVRLRQTVLELLASQE